MSCPQPLFLEIEQVLRAHQSLIAEYGGTDGVREVGLLQSALAQPRAMFAGQFLHDGLFEMAGAYLFHIVQNHPFLDGNKRTGAAAAIIFLAINDVSLNATEEALVDLVLAVAQGQLDKPAIAAWLQCAAAPA